MEPITANTFKFNSTFLGCSLEFEKTGESRKKAQKPKQTISDEKLQEINLMLQKRKDRESKALSQQLKSPFTLGAKAFAAFSNKPKLGPSNSANLVNELGSAKDVLKQYNGNRVVGANRTPVLGRGFKSGDFIEFGKQNAKRKAIETLRSLKSTGIMKVDPNSTRKRIKLDEIVKKVEANIKADDDSLSGTNSKYDEIEAKRRRQEAVNAILSRKSKHENEADQAEIKAQENYYKRLEEKEKKEERMENVTEEKCKVVICKDCLYTAHTVADRCVKESHNYICANAVKRYFKCKSCSHKSYTFNEFVPTKACRNCNAFDFEKTSKYFIKKVKEEKLLIRGEEEKFF